MTPAKATSTTAKAQRRRFRLTVTPVDGTVYGLTVAETNGQAEYTQVVAVVRPADLARLNDTVQVALRASKKAPTTIGPGRKAPVDIDEAPGVRLTLTALAIEPVRRRDRVRQIIEGVGSMSDEEAYYWYAKATQPQAGARALRALRLLLAEDDR